MSDDAHLDSLALLDICTTDAGALLDIRSSRLVVITATELGRDCLPSYHFSEGVYMQGLPEPFDSSQALSLSLLQHRPRSTYPCLLDCLTIIDMSQWCLNYSAKRRSPS